MGGHDIEQDIPFISIAEKANQIKEFKIEQYGESVYMIVGMSKGAAIAFSIVTEGEIHSDYLIFDSGVFIPASPIFLRINNSIQLSYKYSQTTIKARQEKV